MSSIDPGVFKGKPSENFTEFIRRFRRKYERVVREEKTLIEILGDDYLGERAKNIFLTLPEEVKASGFEAVVRELGRLLASDSVAARMRALTELRKLCMRPGQDMTSFWLRSRR